MINPVKFNKSPTKTKRGINVHETNDKIWSKHPMSLMRNYYFSNSVGGVAVYTGLSDIIYFVLNKIKNNYKYRNI